MATVISNSTSILKNPVLQVLTVASTHKLNSRPPASCLTSSRNRRFSSLKRSSFKYPNAFTVPKIKIRCSSAGGITEISESEFSNVVLKSDRPVLVEFVANWCGPCRLMAPAIESIAQEYGDRMMVVKIDHDANPHLIEEYKVYGLPALILFKNGKEVPESRREGAFTKAKLKEYLDTLFESLPVA